MQSNMPQSPVYDDYSEFDDTSDDSPAYNETYYDEIDSDIEPSDGTRRVMWLMLMVLLVIVMACVIAFWFVPYFQTVSLGNPPPLPPAVQT